MKINTVLKTLYLTFCLSYSTLYAQITDSIPSTIPISKPIGKPRYKYIKQLGIGVGIGASMMDLRKVNQRLTELNIGTLDNYTASRTVHLYGGNDQLGASIDVDFETAFENTLTNPSSTYINLEMFSIGSSLYRTLIHSNRVNIWVSGGLSYTYMALYSNAMYV